MELSLKSRKNYEAMRKIRKMVITKEKLRVKDKIDYNRFLELYRKYGKNIDEKDFAKIVLDIPYQKHYYLQFGKTKQTPILSREFISSREIKKIRAEVEAFVKRLDDNKFNYDMIKFLFEKFAGRMDIASFAEDILGISSHDVECLKSDKKRCTKFFRKDFIDKIEIRKRQNDIIKREKLHIDDTITLSEFERLYKIYGKGLLKDVFATKILQIPKSRFNRLKNGRNAYTTILSSYIYNPESVERLREQVIKRERLHIDDLINYERFKELHRKYGAPLSEELFAEEVLDISAVGVKNMRVAKDNCTILTEIEIPEEFVLELRKKVANENGFRQGQKITFEEIQGLYQIYGGVLSQKKFAMLVLDISSDSYNSLACGTNKSTTILKDYELDRFFPLRRKIILENDFKYNQEIDKKTFQRIYIKYGSNEDEAVFAEKVFDIPQRVFNNLKYGNSKKVNILRNEYLPTDEEIEDLKRKIGIEYGLHIKDTINYNKFQEIYRKYAGILNEELFAEKVLDIKRKTLKKIIKDPEREAEVFRETKLSEKEIKDLRREVILDNNIYPERPITRSLFKRMYRGHKHILSERLFAKLILGIEPQCINKLKNHSCKTVKALLLMKDEYKRKSPYLNDSEVELLRESLIVGISEESIATRLFLTMPYLKRNLDMLYRYGRLSVAEIEAERLKRGIDSTNLKDREPQIGDTRKKELKDSKKRAKDAESLRKKVAKVIEDFELTESDFKIVNAYIDNCRERFKYDEFQAIELPDLEESIVLIGGNASQIRFFSKVCISLGLYKKASVFISNNIDNEDITEKEKVKLRELQSGINQANRRQKAVNMILEGIKDSKFISSQTGIAEVDVLDMQNRLGKGTKVDVKEWLNKNFDEED